MRSLVRSTAAIVSVLFLLLLSASLAPARADDGKIKQGFKDAGDGLKSFGKKVGEKGAEAGHAVADAAKKVWYKGKQVSVPLLHDVQRATRKFWDDVIRGKDRTIDSLKGENDRMKKDLGEGKE